MHIWGENYIPKNDKNISWKQGVVNHIRELPGNYPVFTVVMEIYHYVKIIWRIILTPNFLYNIYNHEKYDSGEPVNINIQ